MSRSPAANEMEGGTINILSPQAAPDMSTGVPGHLPSRRPSQPRNNHIMNVNATDFHPGQVIPPSTSPSLPVGVSTTQVPLVRVASQRKYIPSDQSVAFAHSARDSPVLSVSRAPSVASAPLPFAPHPAHSMAHGQPPIFSLAYPYPNASHVREDAIRDNREAAPIGPRRSQLSSAGPVVHGRPPLAAPATSLPPVPPLTHHNHPPQSTHIIPVTRPLRTRAASTANSGSLSLPPTPATASAPPYAASLGNSPVMEPLSSDSAEVAALHDTLSHRSMHSHASYHPATQRTQHAHTQSAMSFPQTRALAPGAQATAMSYPARTQYCDSASVASYAHTEAALSRQSQQSARSGSAQRAAGLSFLPLPDHPHASRLPASSVPAASHASHVSDSPPVGALSLTAHAARSQRPAPSPAESTCGTAHDAPPLSAQGQGVSRAWLRYFASHVHVLHPQPWLPHAPRPPSEPLHRPPFVAYLRRNSPLFNLFCALTPSPTEMAARARLVCFLTWCINVFCLLPSVQKHLSALAHAVTFPLCPSLVAADTAAAEESTTVSTTAVATDGETGSDGASSVFLCALHVYGSTGSGLVMLGSDIDIGIQIVRVPRQRIRSWLRTQLLPWMPHSSRTRRATYPAAARGVSLLPPLVSDQPASHSPAGSWPVSGDPRAAAPGLISGELLPPFIARLGRFLSDPADFTSREFAAPANADNSNANANAATNTAVPAPLSWPLAHALGRRLQSVFRALAPHVPQVDTFEHAPVPVIKTQFPIANAAVDLAYADATSLHAANIVRCVSRVDPRFGPLCLFVKHWSRCRHLTDSRQGTMPSIAWVVLCLHFLCNVEPVAGITEGAAYASLGQYIRHARCSCAPQPPAPANTFPTPPQRVFNLTHAARTHVVPAPPSPPSPSAAAPVHTPPLPMFAPPFARSPSLHMDGDARPMPLSRPHARSPSPASPVTVCSERPLPASAQPASPRSPFSPASATHAAEACLNSPPPLHLTSASPRLPAAQPASPTSRSATLNTRAHVPTRLRTHTSSPVCGVCVSHITGDHECECALETCVDTDGTRPHEHVNDRARTLLTHNVVGVAHRAEPEWGSEVAATPLLHTAALAPAGYAASEGAAGKGGLNALDSAQGTINAGVATTVAAEAKRDEHKMDSWNRGGEALSHLPPMRAEPAAGHAPAREASPLPSAADLLCALFPLESLATRFFRHYRCFPYTSHAIHFAAVLQPGAGLFLPAQLQARYALYHAWARARDFAQPTAEDGLDAVSQRVLLRVGAEMSWRGCYHCDEVITAADAMYPLRHTCTGQDPWAAQPPGCHTLGGSTAPSSVASKPVDSATAQAVRLSAQLEDCLLCALSEHVPVADAEAVCARYLATVRARRLMVQWRAHKTQWERERAVAAATEPEAAGCGASCPPMPPEPPYAITAQAAECILSPTTDTRLPSGPLQPLTQPQTLLPPKHMLPRASAHALPWTASPVVLLNPFIPRATEVLLPSNDHPQHAEQPGYTQAPLPPLPRALHTLLPALSSSYVHSTVCRVVDVAIAAGTASLEAVPVEVKVTSPNASAPAYTDRGPLLLNLCRSVFSDGWCRTLSDFGRAYTLAVTASNSALGSLQQLLDRSREDALDGYPPLLAGAANTDANVSEPTAAAPFSYPYCLGVGFFVDALAAWTQEFRKLFLPAGREAALYELFLRHTLNRRADAADAEARGEDLTPALGLPTSSSLASVATAPNVAVDGDADWWDAAATNMADVYCSPPALAPTRSSLSAAGALVLPGELERLLGDAAGMSLVSMAAEACAPEQDALMLMLLSLCEGERASRRAGESLDALARGAPEEAQMLMALLSAPATVEGVGDGVASSASGCLFGKATGEPSIAAPWPAPVGTCAPAWSAVVRGAIARPVDDKDDKDKLDKSTSAPDSPASAVVSDSPNSPDSPLSTSSLPSPPSLRTHGKPSITNAEAEVEASINVSASADAPHEAEQAPLLSGIVGALTVPPHVFALPHPFPQAECGRHDPHHSRLTDSFVPRLTQPHGTRRVKTARRRGPGSVNGDFAGDR